MIISNGCSGGMILEKFREEDLLEFRNFLDGLDREDINSKTMIILQKMQEIFDYIPEEILLETSRSTGIASSELYGVASFYHQFSFNPKGKHAIQLCLGTACYVKGSGALLKELEEILGIKDGEVTSDGLYSIDTTRCVGACGLAPVVAIDGKIHGKMTPEALHELMDELREERHE